MTETPVNETGQTSRALRDFCTCTRASELLRARRKSEKQNALEARKAAEKILVETLGQGCRARFQSGNDTYVISTKERWSYKSVSSGVVERLAQLWNDVENLKRSVTHQGEGDVVESIARVLTRAGTGDPQKKIVVEAKKLPPRSHEDLNDVPEMCAELVGTLVRAKTELQKGSEEHRDEMKRVQAQKDSAEQSLVRELVTEQSAMRRINLLENDGTSQAYFLRVKPPRAPPKRKVTPKYLEQSIKELLSREMNQMRLDETLSRLCSEDFRERFLNDLRCKLRSHEISGKGAPPGHRIALDKVPLATSFASHES